MFNYDPDIDGPESKDLFDKLYSDIRFDKKLYKQLYKFRIGWMRKGVEYTEFLGGNTIGLHPVRFSSRDDDLLMIDIFNVDPGLVRSNIYKIPNIDKSWAVSTNPVLQTLCYTIHRFIVDGKMGNKLDDAIKECYYIFSYKVFGSLLSHYFKHNTTPAIAKAAYEKLSNRYLIKRLGTWNNVLEYRAKVVIPEDGLHTDRLRTYSADDSVRIINDLQGSIRDTIKYIYRVMEEVRLDDSKIKSTSLIEHNTDSSDGTKDITDRPDKYIHRLKETMSTITSLVDEDLIHLITNFVKSSDAEIIKAALITLSNSHNPKSRDSVYLEHLVLKTIAHCNAKGISSDYRGNIVEIIGYMRGYWSSGSVRDADVKSVKRYIEKATKKSTRRKTNWVIAANSLAVVIYLFVRSIK